MALQIRFQYPTGSRLGYSIERLSDKIIYDFSTLSFSFNSIIPIVVLPEDVGIFVGRYKTSVEPTPQEEFTNGDYVVTVHNLAANNIVVAELGATMFNGNDTSVAPGGPVSGVTSPVNINLSQNIPSINNVPNSIADCLNAARAQGFGQWKIIGNNLNLYAPDGITVVRSFVLDGPSPTERV